MGMTYGVVNAGNKTFAVADSESIRIKIKNIIIMVSVHATKRGFSLFST
jgi:hypothetical protein